MRPRRIPAHVRACVTSALLAAGCATSGPPPEMEQLRQDAQQVVTVVESSETGTPSFIRAVLAIATLGVPATDTTTATGFAFAERYAGLFGLVDARQSLEAVANTVDGLGMRHLALRQVEQGVPVYGAWMSVHLNAAGDQVAAVTNSVVPDLRLPSVQPTIDQSQALAAALDSLPGATEVSSQLAVYPGERRDDPRLAWLVELRDDAAPARNLYVVDAANGRVIDVIDRLYIARNRRTHDANHGTSLPGTLRRSEGQGPVGDADVDAAHDFGGATYDYYSTTHGRDSYDGQGATLVSTANYGTNYQNAFWNGQQMVYGDDFAVRDVVAHELTHAVTEREANLEYRWQSGALNESFSDVFGAMVDRDDWLMGEDLPIGAIRDMENPQAFGDPAHTRDWLVTCNDNEGVHTNSGIPNKAFVNLAQALDKGRAETVFYRALTEYLGSQASLEDAHAAALQSATDLYGAGSAEVQAVDNAFQAVGLDGTWRPPRRCGQLPDLSIVALLVMALLAVGTALTLAQLARART